MFVRRASPVNSKTRWTAGCGDVMLRDPPWLACSRAHSSTASRPAQSINSSCVKSRTNTPTSAGNCSTQPCKSAAVLRSSSPRKNTVASGASNRATAPNNRPADAPYRRDDGAFSRRSGPTRTVVEKTSLNGAPDVGERRGVTRVWSNAHETIHPSNAPGVAGSQLTRPANPEEP